MSGPETALVTGGSGAVGTALVRRLVADGLRVAFTWHRGEERAAALAADTGALALRADLTDRRAVTQLVAAADEALAGVGLLVNNAGATRVLPFALIEEEDWHEVLDANLTSMYLVTHAVVRGMIARRQGVIVNVGSLAGHRQLAVPVHYAAAKAGVTGFTLALARELARYEIRVNEVVPGLLADGVGRNVPEAERAQYLQHCSAGRAGEPAEVAGAVAFLAGPDAGYVNGQSIFVDGGI